MRDVQNEIDYRRIEIDKVGVKNLKYPLCYSIKKMISSIPLLQSICM